MRLLAITDLHGKADVLGRILDVSPEVHYVLLGGDITHFGQPADVIPLVRQAQAFGVPVGAVAGNCDSAPIDQELVRLGVSLHGRGLIDGDVGLQGLSAMPTWRTGMYQFSEDELAGFLEAGYVQVAAARRRVVLSHSPPKGTRDRTHFLLHAGSTALRQFIERTRPALVFCGHIHEARGIGRLGDTTVVNCGEARAGYYAVAEITDDGGVKAEIKQIK